MIYTTADRLTHIASAMESINPEWSAQLKGMANYIRGLESANFNLSTENRELQELVDQEADKLDEAALEEFADKVRTAHEDALAIELSNLDAIEWIELPSCGETLGDLIESLARMEQP